MALFLQGGEDNRKFLDRAGKSAHRGRVFALRLRMTVLQCAIGLRPSHWAPLGARPTNQQIRALTGQAMKQRIINRALRPPQADLARPTS